MILNSVLPLHSSRSATAFHSINTSILFSSKMVWITHWSRVVLNQLVYTGRLGLHWPRHYPASIAWKMTIPVRHYCLSDIIHSHYGCGVPNESVVQSIHASALPRHANVNGDVSPDVNACAACTTTAAEASAPFICHQCGRKLCSSTSIATTAHSRTCNCC